MENEQKTLGLDWLREVYGISPESLPTEARALAGRLGPDGVKKLVENYKGTTFYRGARVAREELTNTLEQMHRLALEGGGRWAPGEPSFGDTPSTWIDQEVDEILEQSDQKLR